MKTGRTLTELAMELERQRSAKRDFIADTRSAEMGAMPSTEGVAETLAGMDEAKLVAEMAAENRVGGVSLNLAGIGRFGVGQYGHRQIAQGAGIPKPYYDRMLSASPELLARNVNHWFTVEPKHRMFRTLDGNVRAMLSDRYRPLDNYDLAQIVLPAMNDLDAEIVSCEITDRRFYLKAVTPRIQGEIKKGDPVQAGLVVSNSEVGSGSLRIEPLLYRLVCLNGMIAASAMKRHHVGRRNELVDFDGAEEFFTDETRQADDRALWLKVRDTIGSVTKQENFDRLISKAQETAERRIESNDIKQVVEVTARKFTLGTDDTNGILRHLIEGGDLTQWGLLNAVTRHAQDVPSYDHATDLEHVGGRVMELSARDWNDISTAKAA